MESTPLWPAEFLPNESLYDPIGISLSSWTIKISSAGVLRIFRAFSREIPERFI